MSLAPPDLLSPAGRLRPSLFGDEDATRAMAGGLLASVEEEYPDAGAAVWREVVYARAFRAKADDLHAEAAEIDVDDEGRRRILDGQVRYYAQQAEAAEARAARLLEAAGYGDAAKEPARGLRLLRPSRPHEVSEHHAGCRPEITQRLR